MLTAEKLGVATNAFTATLFHERYGFSARASYCYLGRRVNDSLVGSTFVVPDRTGVNQVYQIYAAPYGQLDAQIGYDINTHFGLVVSAENLTDSTHIPISSGRTCPLTYHDSGRRHCFGFKFKF